MKMNAPEDIRFNNICRACLAQEGEMKYIQDKLLDMFEICTSLKLNGNDGLPNTICELCNVKLHNAFSFRELCMHSEDTLRKCLEAGKDDVCIEEMIDVEYIKVESEKDQKFMNEDAEKEHGETDEVDYMRIECKESESEDEKPLANRRTRNIQLDPDVINRAILASKQKYNEKRECRLCGFISSNSRGLSLHISHLHKELKDRWCNICYEEVSDLATHNTEHAKNKLYSCIFCTKGFSSQGHLTEHLRSHSTDRPYKCHSCPKSFLSKRHLKVHTRTHSGEKPYECPHCGRCFSQKGSLQGHIKTHSSELLYHCNDCGKHFGTSEELEKHAKKMGHMQMEPTSSLMKKENTNSNNNEADKASQTTLCTVCGKIFRTKSKLRLHMRIHTGETPYRCSYCEKRFSTRGQLVVHVRTHTGEKPHVCHICGKGFAQSSVLNTHMKLHTGRPEQCQICSQRFCRPAELRLHMRKHTGEKPFSCPECDKAFIQRSHLMEHIKIHNDDRPYKCDQCDRAFKQSSSLKSHIQIHTGLKPYKCSQCAYACRQSYALTQHMKQHSGDRPQPDRPHACQICHRAFTTLAMLASHTQAIHKLEHNQF